MITAFLRAVCLIAPSLALCSLVLVASRWCGDQRWPVCCLGLLIGYVAFFKTGWDARSAYWRARCPQRQHRLLVERQTFEEARRKS